MRRTWVVAALVSATVALVGVPAGAAPGDDADRVAAQIRDLQRRADRAATALADEDGRYVALQTELAELERRQTALTEQLAGLGASLRQVALSRYVGATIDVTGGLTRSLADPNEAAVARYLVELATGGGRETLDRYRVTAEDLARTEDAQRDRLARSDALREAMARAQTSLQAHVADLERELVQRRADAAVQAALAARRRAEADAAAKDAASRAITAAPAPAAAPDPLAVAAAPRAQTSVRGTGLMCPVAGASAFGDSWGAIHQGKVHEGVDMMGRLDQEVVAVVSGTARHTRSGLGGNQVWLYGDDGNKYFYAHLNRYGGAGRVTAGDVVGFMGSTGQTGVVHLHFEIHPGGGRSVNPYPTVRALC